MTDTLSIDELSPSITRRSSWNSSTSAGGDIFDADLVGVPTDMDGNPIVSDIHPTSTITDLMQTFWKSTSPRIDIDLLDRKLKKASETVRKRVQQPTFEHTKDVAANRARQIASDRKREIKILRAKATLRVERLQAQWAEQKNVRLRDKLSFVIGVMNLVCSSLLFAYAPEWMPVSYSVQALLFLPIRVYSYYRLHWHYFLFDYCYFSNILNLSYIWLFPDNKFLFLACYCSSHGPLAFSIATWRNSAVFHSIEKMTSLFIHLYPPITFCAMRHFMPEKLRDERFPAIGQLPTLDSWTAFAWNVFFYVAWQVSYYLLISKRKAKKIASGERINSYSTMSKGKGAVAKVLARTPSERREWAFIVIQFLYTIICTLPAPLLLYNSRRASSIFCLLLILLSVWNGATYYVEVWGRRFERELDALRRELEASQKQTKALNSGDASVPMSRSTSLDGEEQEHENDKKDKKDN